MVHFAIGSELDVGGFQVAVDDAVLMRFLESVGDLASNRESLINRKRASGQSIRKRFARDQFQNEKPNFIQLFESID
jgi:hypothetical protein